MFPQGGPGFGLLLLRVSVAATLLIDAVNRSRMSSPILFGAILLISALIVVGLLTPFASLIAAASAVGNLIMSSGADNLAMVSLILTAAALALLGPGAYSLDSRFFGRRVMVVPPRN
jgi:multisubunit Na+/H+ antiporter MnhB subunit